MLPEFGSRSSTPSGGDDNFEGEIGFLLDEQRPQDVDDREKELNLYRSGSAPPTFNESIAAGGDLSMFSGKDAVNGFRSEDEMRSDPAYLTYYYSNVNLNPRLPPPSLSKEDWRMSQRFHGGCSVLGGIGDKRKLNRKENGGARVPTAIPPGFDMVKQECDVHVDKGSTDWDRDGLIGLSGIGLGTKSKSIAEILQDDLGHSTAPLGILSDDPSDFHREPSSCDTFGPDAFTQGSSALRNIGKQSPCSYAAALGASSSRSTTPDAQLVARVHSPHLGPIGKRIPINGDKMAMKSMKSYDDVSSGGNESFELANKFPSLAASFSAMNLTNGAVGEDSVGFDVNQSCLSHMQGVGDNSSKKLYKAKSFSGHLSASMYQPNANMNRVNENGFNYSSPLADRSFELQNSSYTRGNTSATPYAVSFDSEKEYIRPSQHCNFNGCAENQAQGSLLRAQLYLSNGQMLSHFDRINASPARVPCRGGFTNQTDINKLHYQGADSVLHQSYVDPMYLQGLRNPGFGAAQVNALNDSCMDRDYLRNSYIDVFGLQKAYLGGLVSPQKAYYGDKSRRAVDGLYENHSYDVGGPHPGSPLASPYLQNSFAGHGSPIMDGGFNMNYPFGVRNSSVVNPWQLENEFSIDGCFTSSLLEEFKSNKGKPIELSEIAGHVVEFSADQYGSRFIQQKLETATVGETDMVFEEIMPHALSLMTDVFGNYVVQKFFEYGAASQRRELANKLTGHVLSLSLQMYGCRVIQKAIEVVDVDQKITMVGELDGHVVRCVRDQNGNHVIQKCIECVPEDSIQFIVTTFFGQVVALSTHPYGCRVIQRILEHCNDPKTQSQVMDEILSSVCMLAQDQYGNYVVQHVLEHGKPHERSAIIKELTGKVVQMSQQKFASNVVEKCLTFAGPSERQLLVTEILGSTDENEPLQAMMKDQFANYVVQKVLETCDDQQREVILSRIKVHLNALKKYTYGKHIVVRVEKLVIAGERRSGQSAQSVNAAGS